MMREDDVWATFRLFQTTHNAMLAFALLLAVASGVCAGTAYQLAKAERAAQIEARV